MKFEHDDSGYLTWVRNHRNGYVLNVRSYSDPDYVDLHRARCKTISREQSNPSAYTGGGYRKIVGDNRDELKFAAVQQGRIDGSFSRECSLCSP